MGNGKIPKFKREAQSWRVRTLEGYGPSNFGELFSGRLDTGAAIQELKEIAAFGGDPHKIDANEEAVAVAWRFLTSKINPGPYRGLLGHKILRRDVAAYQQEYWDKKLESDRAKLAAGLNFHTISHPLMQVVDQLPVSDFHKYRGLPVFDKLASEIVKQLPSVAQKRSLNVLYPAAGDHYAPLLTAFRLIDQRVVDSVHMTYTELDQNYAVYVRDFRRFYQAGLIDRLVTSSETQFSDGGTERTLTMRYKGKEVSLTLALNRSGRRFYRDDYLRAADLVVLHDTVDPGALWGTYRLLADILATKHALIATKPQMIVMEGRRTNDDYERGGGRPMLNFTPAELAGPYGHCGGKYVDYLGEYAGCVYETAYAFRLDGPQLQAQIQDAQGVVEIHRRLFKTDPSFMSIGVTVVSIEDDEDED